LAGLRVLFGRTMRQPLAFVRRAQFHVFTRYLSLGGAPLAASLLLAPAAQATQYYLRAPWDERLTVVTRSFSKEPQAWLDTSSSPSQVPLLGRALRVGRRDVARRRAAALEPALPVRRAACSAVF
jgi:hypothetical protein